MTIPPRLFEALSRSSILSIHAEPSRGSGERRSQTKGAGIEFADYRMFEPGDDLRHVDLRVRARLGVNVVRQYSVYQKLPITIIIDGSASMNVGEPRKFEVAKSVAVALAYAGLVGGDRVRILMVSGGKLHSSGWVHGTRRIEVLIAWLARQRPGGATFLESIGPLAGQTPRSMVILLSDWMVGDVDRDIASLRSRGMEMVGVQILAPEEDNPDLLGSGEVNLVDLESGELNNLVLSAALKAEYSAAIARWRSNLREIFVKNGGRFLTMLTSDDLFRLVTLDWRKQGLLS